MITKRQRANAERIKLLSDWFGHLPFNAAGQTPNGTLNLSIPCAVLVVADVVTGVRDTFDGVNDQALEDVERYCREAVAFSISSYGLDWLSEETREKASELLSPLVAS